MYLVKGSSRKRLVALLSLGRISRMEWLGGSRCTGPSCKSQGQTSVILQSAVKASGPRMFTQQASHQGHAPIKDWWSMMCKSRVAAKTPACKEPAF